MLLCNVNQFFRSSVMDKIVRIAIIDNEINELLLKENLENSIFIDGNGNCVVD